MGCKEGSVLAPVDEPGGVNAEPTLYGISSTPDNPDLAVYRIEGKSRGYLVSADKGGVVGNGRVSLEIPAGALDEDTYISMEMVDKSNLVVEFGPEGLVFNKPVTMTMKLTGTVAENRAATTRIKWYNPENGKWDEIPNLPVASPDKVGALLEHFSKYGADVGG
jgi:hypothetical protein